MNKRIVEKWIPYAFEALDNKACCKISDQNNNINKAYRGQISAFGAAITMGSFKMAAAAFSKDSKADNGVDRSELLRAMDYIINKAKNNGKGWRDPQTIARAIFITIDPFVIAEMKEDYINASIALKQAMNAFNLVKGG